MRFDLFRESRNPQLPYERCGIPVEMDKNGNEKLVCNDVMVMLPRRSSTCYCLRNKRVLFMVPMQISVVQTVFGHRGLDLAENRCSGSKKNGDNIIIFSIVVIVAIATTNHSVNDSGYPVFPINESCFRPG